MDTLGIIKSPMWVEPPRTPDGHPEKGSNMLIGTDKALGSGHPAARLMVARVGLFAKKGRALYHEDPIGTTPYTHP